MEKKKEVEEGRGKPFTGEQMDVVEEYYTAISSTMGICELLAYKQGMKDMASILK